jgi:enoyl-CoA hydratase
MGDYIIKKEQGLLQFIINRPSKRNAVNYEVMEGLEKALEECEKNEDIKLLVITGTGENAFCSGGDLSLFRHLKTEDESYAMLSKMGKIVTRLALLSKPTIAVINGIAIGGGCELATACDFRISKKEARMGFVQGDLAITTGWGGSTLLLEKMPTPKALSLLMSARIHTAQIMHDVGFVEELLDDTRPILEVPFIQSLLNKSTGVLTAYKSHFLSKLDRTKIERNIESEIVRCSKLWALDEHHQAVQRFLEK